MVLLPGIRRLMDLYHRTGSWRVGERLQKVSSLLQCPCMGMYLLGENE